MQHLVDTISRLVPATHATEVNEEKFVNVATSEKAIRNSESALAQHPDMWPGPKQSHKTNIAKHKKWIEQFKSKQIKESVELDESVPNPLKKYRELKDNANFYENEYEREDHPPVRDDYRKHAIDAHKEAVEHLDQHKGHPSLDHLDPVGTIKYHKMAIKDLEAKAPKSESEVTAVITKQKSDGTYDETGINRAITHGTLDEIQETAKKFSNGEPHKIELDEEVLDEIAIGKSYKIPVYSIKNNQRIPTEVKVTDYKKSADGTAMVHFKHKEGTGKLDSKLFKAKIIKESVLARILPWHNPDNKYYN